jgi:hypothetical protein
MTPMNQPHLWQGLKCGKASDVARLVCRATLDAIEPLLLVRLLTRPLERSAENVAQGRA